MRTERHLRHLLLSHKTYYNETRTAPVPEQGCAIAAHGSADRPDFQRADLGWPPSSIWPDLFATKSQERRWSGKVSPRLGTGISIPIGSEATNSCEREEGGAKSHERPRARNGGGPV